jgi:hypothetical protein
MMSRSWLWSRDGKVPCSVCQVPTPIGELTECWVPAIVVQFAPGVEIMPLTAVWVCLACPLVGEVKR